MPEVMTTTQERRAAKRDKTRLLPDDIVSANGLATHLGCTRQNIARLTAEAVIEQRSDGCYDQTASRLKYIRHLRSEHRRSPRTQARYCRSRSCSSSANWCCARMPMH